MKTSHFSTLAGSILSVLGLMSVQAQVKDFEEEPAIVQRNLGGPRLGITYVPGNGKLAEELNDNGVGRTLSQFGWHFEYRIVPEGGGPQFLIQAVPLIAGVEYGKLVPSGTIAMGVRFPNGFEFGLGPNALVTSDGISSSLVLGIGKSFDYGGVSIPLNLVMATNPDGARFSIVFGYAIARK